MKYIKNIKLLMLAELLLQIGIGFAYDPDYKKQGQEIIAFLKNSASTPVPKLIEAVKNGNLDEVKSVLNSPEANINDVDSNYGKTALMYAAKSGRKDIVKLLLDKGADPNIVAWGDETALRNAVKNGHKDIIKLLLDTNAEFKKRSMGGALVEAAQQGHKDIVELLINKGADPNSTAYYDGYSAPTDTTALVVASGKGHKDIVRVLLDKGAYVNSQCSSMGNTALILATAMNHKHIAKLLIDNGADTRIANVHGNTALQIAKLNGNKELAQLLLANSTTAVQEDLDDQLINAATNGNIEAVNACIAAGAHVDAKDSKGRGPLIWAAENGYTDIVKLLIDKGANVNASDTFGFTAFRVAAHKGYSGIVKILIDKGGIAKDLNILKEILMAAEFKRNTEIVNAIKDHLNNSKIID